MLSRVGNDLFWMGRYIERTDHIARYMGVNYFTSLDAPNSLSNSRKFVLESMLFMAGCEYSGETGDEEQLLFFVGLDTENPLSILNTATNARQNAMGTRHLISTELWEVINKYYHYIANYSPEVFTRTGLHDMTVGVNEHCSLIRNKVNRTLLHDEVYHIIVLGMYLERAIQITRIIRTKLYDVERIAFAQPESHGHVYEWTTLLKCCEAFDMSKKNYKKVPDKWEAIEFMCLNRLNPKSIVYCLSHINHNLQQLSHAREYAHESVEFTSGKFHARLKYVTIGDIIEDLEGFLQDTLKCLNEISAQLQHDYLSV